MRVVSFTLAASLLLTGCDDGDGVSGPDGGGDASSADAAPDAPPPATSLADVCDAGDGLYVAFYQKIFTCFPEYGLFLGEIPTAAEIDDACEGGLGPFLDDGTVTLGGADALEACRDWIDGVDCASLNDDASTPCDEVIVGHVELNDPCDANEQCAGQAFCDKSGAGECGICRAEKSNDTTCEEDFECASGFCHPETSTCETRAGEGDTCSSKDDCGGTRACSPTTDRCVDEPSWTAGTPCRDFIDCNVTESGLYCDATMGQCRAFLGLGETCSDTTALCNLIRYEHCGEATPGSGVFTCLAPTTVTVEGAECNFFLGQKCGTGLVCRDHDEVEDTPSICVSLGGLGEACNESDQPCHLFLECVGGQCQYGFHTGECSGP